MAYWVVRSLSYLNFRIPTPIKKGKVELKEDIPVLFIGLNEAEAVKLFVNTHMALRVSYFNELDTYAEIKGLDTQAIINGMNAHSTATKFRQLKST